VAGELLSRSLPDPMATVTSQGRRVLEGLSMGRRFDVGNLTAEEI
jgi:hypothetical protein